MADITLSKAVRSNLLSLQSTANSLAKTQERLATGLKVNSALDNPTNFFTASSLSSRASDLGRLLDSVSNAKSTIEAADKGLTSITKLVESAQATARQALQTSATVDTTTAATAGEVAGGSFTSVDVSNAGSTATSGALAGTAVTAVDVSGTGSVATAGSVVGGTFTNIDFTNGGSNDGSISFDLTLDGGTQNTITVAYADVNGTAANNAAVTASELAGILNSKINTAEGTSGVTYASVNGSGGIDITSNTTGTSSSVDIASFAAANGATGSGLADGNDTGSAAVAADSISFSLTVDGGTSDTITIDDAAVTTYNAANSTSLNSASLSAADLVLLINDQATNSGSVASVNGTSGGIDFTSTTTGTSSSVAIASFTDNSGGGDIGLADGSDTGSAAVAADAISFSLTIDGGTASTITIDDAAVTTYNAANSTSLDSSALTAANIVSLINDQAGATVASVNATSGGVDITSTTTGTSSSVAIASYSASVTAGSTGIADGSDTGSAASTTTSANPKRDEYVTQYNELLTQIDDLAGDASFNGVNLLAGDDLSVLFNEDGSSSLDITGVTYDSAGLGLSSVSSGGFDSDSAINTVLDDLSAGIDTLRTQASTFGSNLSVVEIRQNFTKDLINTLETGAANLTLADSNEEAANLLALQTRQQLSSTALSLASQADQNVLRLF
ncbi:MAG: flagellar hook protein [Hyphomicrobiaceae bacterium]|nr:flagellar hook protein [Hyphomicrobiaceae bacterium]